MIGELDDETKKQKQGALWLLDRELKQHLGG
jgi:hypothetical protein